MKNRIHTVIFDLDGTLSDSALLTIAAFKNVLPKHGLSMPSKEAIRRATGFATPEFYYIMFPDSPRDKVYNAGMEVDEEELRLMPSIGSSLLFEGCGELLTRLRESGMCLHIASTGERDHVFSILNGTGITHFFDSINCGRPDKTEMLGEIIGDSDKDGFIMVGDMKKDYEAARVNRIISVGACFGYCVKELAGFDFYIDKPLDLLDIIE
jgi:phosphoglycolate phosphatase-like HAD superfamily hydrolase